MKPTTRPDEDDRCLNGRCWTGPMLIVETDKGAIGDLCVALKIFLCNFYRKELADLMVRMLTLAHIDEESTIIAFAMGREPHATIMREVCALISVHALGTLQTNSASYTFKLQECDDAPYRTLLSHYQWMKALDMRSSQGKHERED